MKNPDDRTRVAGANGTVERSALTVPKPPWSDPERAARVMHRAGLKRRLYDQRRHVKALDRHLGIEPTVVDLTAISPDYWADCGMSWSLEKRAWHGRLLAERGWTP